MDTSVRSRWLSVGRFAVLAYLLSWTPWGVLIALGRSPGLSVVGGGLWVLGGFGPTISALVLCWRADRSDGVRSLLGTLARWRRSPGWYVAVLGIPAVVAALTVAAGVVTGVVTVEALHLDQLWLLGPLFVSNVLIGGGLGEELGWRGYALPRLQERYSALTASLAVGAIWAVWHAPLFALPGTVQTEWPLAWFLAMGFGLSVLFTWLYNGTRGSVLLVVCFHAAFNAALSGAWLTVGDVEASLARWAVLAVLAAAVVVTAWSGPAHLSRRHRRWTEARDDPEAQTQDTLQ